MASNHPEKSVHNVNRKNYDEGYARIFGKKESPKCDTCRHWVKGQYKCDKWHEFMPPSSAEKSWCDMHSIKE